MVKKHYYKGIAWIDLESPTENEILEVSREYNLHPKISSEIMIPTPKPQTVLFDNCLFAIIHFPAIHHTHMAETKQEIDFVIGKNFIITTRYEQMEPINEFSKIFEVNAIVDKTEAIPDSGWIFYEIVKKMYACIMEECEVISDSLKMIEENIFKNKEREMVEALSNTSRDIIDLRHGMSLHAEILESLSAHGKAFLGEQFVKYTHHLLEDCKKLHVSIESNRELMRELRETNDSVLTTKQNELIKTFSILAFFTFPLSVLVAVFALDTVDNPIINMPNAFFVIILIIVAVIILMYSIFKHKKWL